jgi:hypothetical protein
MVLKEDLLLESPSLRGHSTRGACIGAYLSWAVLRSATRTYPPPARKDPR